MDEPGQTNDSSRRGRTHGADECAGKRALARQWIYEVLKMFDRFGIMPSGLSDVTFVRQYINFVAEVTFAFASIAACSIGARGSRFRPPADGLFSWLWLARPPSARNLPRNPQLSRRKSQQSFKSLTTGSAKRT